MLLSLPLPTAFDRVTVQSLRRKRPSRGMIAAMCAVLAHAVVLGLIVRMATRPVAQAPETRNFVMLMSPAQPSQPAPAPEAPAPKTISAARLQPAQLLTTQSAPVTAPAPLRVNAAPRAEARPRHPLALAAHSPAKAPAPPQNSTEPAQLQLAPTAVPPDNGQALAALEARIDDAVRRQAVMPPAAIRQHRDGRAQLRFSYLDGTVDSIAVAQSSESRLLDAAAVQAVRAAHYPAPPAGLRGRRLALQVWIDFRLASSPS